MAPQIRYARRPDGARTAYAVTGDGPVLLYTPGFVSHLEWTVQGRGDPRFRAELAKRRTIVDYDRHGCGLSDRNRTDFTPEDDMLDVETVIAAIGASVVDVFASSYGGLMAVRYAAEHPERVRKMILWATLPFNDRSNWPAEHQARIAALRELRRTDWSLYMATAVNQMFPAGVQPEVFRSLVSTNRQAATPEMMDRLEEMIFDNRPYFSRVTAPTLVLHRRGDQMVPFAASEYLARRLPNARFVPLDGDEHLPNWNDVDPVLEQIIPFLDDSQPYVPTPVVPAKENSAATAGTSVILFTDVADSTALTERLGDAAFRDASRELDQGIRAAIREHNGAPVEGKVLGDGVMGVFRSAAQAIAAARRCAALEGELSMHIGLHAGDVTSEGNNVYGGAVNIAARICGLCEPGEILVSATVRDLARTSAGVTFEDRGEHALKGIADPVRLFAVFSGE